MVPDPGIGTSSRAALPASRYDTVTSGLAPLRYRRTPRLRGDNSGSRYDNAQRLRARQRGDLDGLGALLAEDFVEHDELPGLPPTKEGVGNPYFTSLLTSISRTCG